MYYGLLATVFLLYVGWMLKSWRDSLEDGAVKPAHDLRLGGWAGRNLTR
jgi:hypothetical protein